MLSSSDSSGRWNGSAGRSETMDPAASPLHLLWSGFLPWVCGEMSRLPAFKNK